MNKIVDLQWTDVYASLVTGTKSRLGNVVPGGRSRVFFPFPESTGEVLVYRKKIIYQYEYAAPAFVCCFVWMIWVLTCLYMWMVPRYKEKISASGLTTLINQLSVGRFLSQGVGSTRLSNDFKHKYALKTKDWLKVDGQRRVAISGWLFQQPDGRTPGMRSRKGVSATGEDVLVK